jgi:uncharacterized membrane-anchored protein
MQSLPKINSRYWIALCAASIFGTNTGDYLAEEMHINHLVGLAPLAVLLALIFGAARIVPQAAIFLFWAAIITVRTAATNVGDAFHGFNIHFETSIPLVTIVLIAAVYAYRASRPANADSTSSPPFNATYWVCIMMAGIWGTLVGDFASFGLHLGTFGASLILGAVVAYMLFRLKPAQLLAPFTYWSAIAMIRAAGTAAGDFFAHSMGLSAATIFTGLSFIALVWWFYGHEKDNVATV